MLRTAPGSRLAYLLFATLLALSLVAAALPRPAAAAVDASCEDTHTVKEGENIYSISKKYGITVSKLEKANNLEDPYSLTVGQQLCIPAAPKASSNYKWSATFNGSKVEITGEKFKKNHPFIVKARLNDTAAWYKLGKAAADKNGEMEASLKVPSQLAKAQSIKVCLKDGVTDYLDCKLVWRR
jgi:murein DD-endopeptidase MepM/ murein hydrolase activator NlpD